MADDDTNSDRPPYPWGAYVATGTWMLTAFVLWTGLIYALPAIIHHPRLIFPALIACGVAALITWAAMHLMLGYSHSVIGHGLMLLVACGITALAGSLVTFIYAIAAIVTMTSADRYHAWHPGYWIAEDGEP